LIAIVGWDVGGANTKAAWLQFEGGEPRGLRTASRPYEIWREKERLPGVLRETLAAMASEPPQAMALTMTAELADVFATKREGVFFVLDSVAAAFPACPVYALSLAGEFVPLAEARARPLDFAAANWLATALFVARQQPDCLLVDVGSTTTDIIPILGGQVAAQGRTDLDRLLVGELVYTGLLRTHLAAIVQRVPVRGRLCPVSSEYFAVSGDVHLILGHIGPEDYTCPTPDGRPPTVESARARLARLVCADAEMSQTPVRGLSAAEIDALAAYVHQQQLRQIEDGLLQVLARLTGHRDLPVVAVGSGAFLAVAAGRCLGLTVLDLQVDWGREGSEVAPCLAAAHLLAEQLGIGSP
jgi:probable H4MPT-linked C1 transfer pathway protein